MRLRWFILAALSLVLAFGVVACGDDDDDEGGEAQLNLTIGDLLPLTGDLSDFGPPGRKASELAVREIQSAIQEAGVDHAVEVVHADTETNEQAAPQAARRLVADGASCLTGAWASSSSIPTAESVANVEEVAMISPASTSDELTEIGRAGYFSRTAPPDSFQGPALADAIEADVGEAEGTVVNIGTRNDAYGTGLADTFTQAWEDKGGEIGARVVYDPEQPSYNSEAAQIVEGDPERFVIIDFPETFQNVGAALVRTGEWDPARTWTTDGLASQTLPEDAGLEATEGMRGTAPGAPDEGEASEAFNTLFEAAPGPERMTFDAQNFDATVICYLAAVAAGSTDGGDIADAVRGVTEGGDVYTWQQLPDAVEALQNGDDIDYEGASGSINMDSDTGDTTSGVYDLFRYQDGELDIVDEVPIPEQ